MSFIRISRFLSVQVFLCLFLVTGSSGLCFAIEDAQESTYFKSLHNLSMSDDSAAFRKYSKPLFLKKGADALIGEENAEALSNFVNRYFAKRLSLDITPPDLPAFRNQIRFNDTHAPRTVLLQANYDFPQASYGTPFLNAGLGLISSKREDFGETVNFESRTSSKDDFILEAGGGLQIPLDDDVSFTGVYRYRDTNDTEFSGADLDYRAHEFRFGLSFKLQPDAIK